LVTLATIELQNCWGSFVRAYYLSALLHARTESGHIVRSNSAIRSLDDGIGIAVRWWNPRAHPAATGVWRRRDEPPWFDPSILLGLSKNLLFSNNGDIQAALSMQSRAFADLPILRNFFAHRNQASAFAAISVAVQYSIGGIRVPSDVLLSRAKGRPQVLVLDWIDDIRATVEMLCG